MKPAVVTTGVRFPEGPVWCPDPDGGAGTLVCTSVADGSLERVHLADGRVERLATLGGGPNGAAACSDGGFLVTQNGGIDFTRMRLYGDDPPPYRPVTPGLERVGPDSTVAYYARGEFLAPNDLVVDEHDLVWFTDPPPFPPGSDPAGRVHTMRRDGSTAVAASGFLYCNGIGLEPDGTPVIVEDRGLLRLRPDGEHEWIVEELTGGAGDGFCLDEDGRFYVANTAAHGIRVVEPDGTEVDFLALDGEGVTTNCCFGGANHGTLFATDGVPGRVVAWEGMSTPGLRVRPWPGP